MAKLFNGSLVALITPMNADDGMTIDYKSLQQLVEHHIEVGTNAIVVAGTTGEAATLEYEEYLALIAAVVKFANTRIPIIAGTGANATAKAIQQTQAMENLGVAGCLTVTPYYNKPTQEGLYTHFKAIAESSRLPQILYNVPGRTGCDLQPETVARLAEIPNIIGLKDATGDLSRVRSTRQRVGNDFLLLSGDDMTALDFMQLGGDGVISVTANVAAKAMASMCRCALAGNFAAADNDNQPLALLHHQLFVEPNPIPVKWACKTVGLIASDSVRLPLLPLSQSAQPDLTMALQAAKLLAK